MGHDLIRGRTAGFVLTGPGSMCLVETVAMGGRANGCAGLNNGIVGDNHFYGRRELGGCVIGVSQSVGGNITGSICNVIQLVVFQPGNGDAELVVAQMHQVPLGIIAVSLCLGNIIPAVRAGVVIVTQPQPGAIIGIAACRQIVTSGQFHAADKNLNAVEFSPDRITLFVVDLVVLDFLVTVVVGGSEGDLIGYLVADIGRVGIFPDGIAVLVNANLNLLVEVGSGLLVLIDHFNVGRVGVDRNRSAEGAGDQVVAVIQILELNFLTCSLNRSRIGCVCTVCYKVSKVLDQLGIVNAFPLCDSTGVGVISEEGIGCRSVSTEECLEELVIGLDAVCNRFSRFAIGIELKACVENLVDCISLIDGCVRNGDRAGVFGGKSRNAQGKNQSQHHQDG